MNKIIINVNGIPIYTVPKMKAYCSMSQIFSTYSTPHDALFLVFGVSNAKYLAFDTPDENVLYDVTFSFPHMYMCLFLKNLFLVKIFSICQYQLKLFFSKNKKNILGQNLTTKFGVA